MIRVIAIVGIINAITMMDAAVALLACATVANSSPLER